MNFDPSTARPVESTPFDPTTAVPEDAPPVRTVLKAAATIKPDDMAEAERLAKRYPAPVDTLYRNLADIRVQEAVDLADERLKTSPKLSAALAQSARLAKLAHDDVEPLSRMEAFTNALQRGLTRTMQGTDADNVVNSARLLDVIDRIERGELKTDADIARVTPYASMFAGAGRSPESLARLRAMASRNLSENTAEYLTREKEVKGLPASRDYEEFQKSATFGEALSRIGGAPVRITSEVVAESLGALAPAIPLIAGAGVAGGPAALAGAVGLTSAGTEYVNALPGIFQKLGVDLNDLEAVRAAVRTPEFQEEARKAIVKAGVIGAFDAATAGVAGVTLGKTPIRNLAAQTAVQAGGGGAGEAAGSTAIGEEISPAAVLSEMLGEVPGAVLDVAVIEGRKALTEAGKRVGAEASSEQLAEALKTAGASALRERSPEQFRALMQTMTDGKVYIDGEVLNQLSPEVLATLPEAVQQDIPNAAAIGAAVELTVADILTVAPGTPLEQVIVENARMAPDAMSQVEAQAAGQRAGEYLQQEAERVILAAQDQEAARASQEAVKQNIKAQLAATGRFRDAVNEGYATWASAFYTAYGSRMGVTPEEFFQRYPLRILGEPSGQPTGYSDGGRPGAITVEGYHFSDQVRPVLSTAFYGSRYAGNARDEIMAYPDERVRKRLSFYVDKGTGIRPEAGVGGVAHRVRLANIYDANTDPLKLRGGDAREFETRVLDAGFSGYIDRLDGDQPGQVVVLGDQTFQPELLGPLTSIEPGQRPPALQRREAPWRAQATGAPEMLQPRLERMQANPSWAGYDMRIEGDQLLIREKAGVLEQRGEQKPGKPVPTSVDAVANVNAAFELANGQQFKTNRELKLALQERLVSALKAAKISLDDFNAGAEQYLVRVALTDAQIALETNPNAVGWYNEKVTKALRLVALVHPEILTDPQAKFAFVWAMAVTSNGLKVDKNFELAEQAYSTFKSTGKMPTDIQAGQAQAAINNGLALFNEMLAKHGFEALQSFMTTKATVKEIQAFSGLEVGGENLTTEVYGSAILGPKIGNGFFSNLYGRFEQLTVDRWLMRTWGRWTGTLIETNPEQVRAKRVQLRALIQGLDKDQKKAFESIIKRKLTVGDPDAVALAIWKASQKPINRARMAEVADAADEAGQARLAAIMGPLKKGQKRTSFGDELRKVGNALTKYNDGQKEAPSGPPERGRIRKVFSQALARLQETYPALTMSDLQALLWYPEKRLYDAAKEAGEGETGYDDDAAPDYANAAAKLAREKGVPEEDIARTIEEVDNELRATDRAAGAGRASGGQAPDAQTAEGGVRDGAGVRGSSGVLEQQPDAQGRAAAPGGLNDGQAGNREGRYSSGGLAPLEGAPAVAGATGPDPRLVAVAEDYARRQGIRLQRQASYAEVDPERAARIAAAYEAMQHAPNGPKVKEAYDDLAQQTLAQYLALEAAGYQFYLVDESNDPYAGNPWNAMRDLRANQRMGVFATEAGFGTSEFDPAGNPLLADTGLEWGYGSPDGPKKRVLFNDLFRAVHDAFGHGLEGAGFRAQGEENAWQAHVRLFTGPAVGAITSETRGQNSWLNYGPHGEKNRTAKVEDTIFADQKTGLMPEWTWTEGRVADASEVLKQTPRGTFNPASLELVLNPNANLSTFFHETGHFFLEVMADIASQPDAPAQIVEDMSTFLKWAGIKGDENVGGLDAGGALNQEDSEAQADAVYQEIANDEEMIDALEVYMVIGDPPEGALNDRLLAYINRLPPVPADSYLTFYRNQPSWAKPWKRGWASWTINEDQTRFFGGKGYEVLKRKGVHGLDLNRLGEHRTRVTGVYSQYGSQGEWLVLNESVFNQNGATAPTQPITPRRTPLETWNAMTLDQKRPYHERWAESIEQYVMEGRAPSVELQPLMRRFATWLKSVYGSIKQFLASRGQAAPGSEALNQAAYHGTPHRGIKKFSTDAIGTGEGNQAYGWGLYFASKREIAEHYRKALTSRDIPVFFKDGAELRSAAEIAQAYYTPGKVVNGYGGRDKVLGFNREGPYRWGVDVVEVDANGEPVTGARKRTHSTMPDPKDLERDLVAQGYEAKRGQVYKVEVPEDDALLLWDKPLSEQPEKVRQALYATGYTRDADGMTGRELYQDTADSLAGGPDGEDIQELASKLFMSKGIKGIKYLDGTSRGAGDGSYNYVVFSGDDVAITDQFYQNPTAPAGPQMALNDDIRRVMDRMLATDEQIAQANEVAGLMPDEDADALANERLRKRSIADLKWSVRARDAAIAKLQKQAKAIEKGIREQVTAEVDAMPESRAKAALDALQVSPEFNVALDQWKADRAAAEKAIGEEVKAALLALNPEAKGLVKGQLLAKNKRDIANKVEARMIDWDKANPKPTKAAVATDQDLATVADSFGYESTDAMLQAVAAFDRRDLIDGMTEQRMLEEHGDLVDERAIQQAANEAVHNEARARSLATELRTQAEMLGARTDTGETNAKGSRITVNALVEAAKQFAANVVGRTPLRDLKSKAWQHTAAERRAAKRWQEATAAGKTEDAVKAKQDQMLNHAAAKAALDAQAEAQKILDFFKRVTKGNDETVVEKGRDADIINAARAVLATYGVETSASKGAQAYLDVLKTSDPATYAVIEPMVQAATQNAQPLQALTFDELQALHEEVQAMWFLAKRSRQMEVDGDLMDIDDAADEVYARLEEIGIPDTVPGESGALTRAEIVARQWLQQAPALLRRVEQWAEAKDGKFGGPFLRYIFQPVKDAADRYRTDRLAYRQKFQALVDKVAPTFTKGTIEAPELGYTFGRGHNGIGHAELLHALLHTGNEGNKRKLLLGRGWATENADGTLDTGRWDAFIKRMADTGVLTPAHYDFAQGVWDLMEETKPLAQKTHRDVFGRYFAEVTAEAFTDPWGQARSGGYVPAQADPLLVQDADLRELLETENAGMSQAFPATARGFTKARVDYNRPLKLDLRTLPQHIDKVLLFSHMEPAVRGVARLLRNKKVGQPLARVDPAAMGGMLKPWLNRAARQTVETPISADAGLNRMASTVRGRVGMALMFANVSNTLQQITGVFTAALKVKPGAMRRALAQYIANPKKLKDSVWAMSPYMADRASNEVAVLSDTLEAILINPTTYQRAEQFTRRHAYFMQTFLDNQMSPIIWTGAYNQALAEGMDERMAARFADGVIRQTQGSTLPEDVSRIETGPAYARLFTQFVGYFNMMANTNATAVQQIAGEVGLKRGAGKALGVLTIGLLVPIWIAEGIAHAMRGGPEDEDDDGYLDDWLAAVFGFGTIRGLLAGVPFLGAAAQSAVNRFNDQPADDKFSLSPTVSVLESAVGAPASVYKAIVDDASAQKALRDASALITVTTGLPAMAAARPLGYLAGIADDRIEPTGPADAARGLITGTASPESKAR